MLEIDAREALPPDTRDVYAEVHRRLLAYLEALPNEGWSRPTACPGWSVRDLVAHLLDSDLRRLSLVRDGHQIPGPGPGPLDDWSDLVGYLNDLNHSWIVAAGRLSPTVLIDLHRLVGPQVVAFFDTLDLEASAAFPVAWAGDHASTHRFDLAREYTEKWIHQQQIRDACGGPALEEPALLGPLLATLLHALPRAYAAVDAEVGIRIGIEIVGAGGGHWSLVRGTERWVLARGDGGSPAGAAASVRLPETVAWRLLASRRKPEAWPDAGSFDGPEALLAPWSDAVAIMA